MIDIKDFYKSDKTFLDPNEEQEKILAMDLPDFMSVVMTYIFKLNNKLILNYSKNNDLPRHEKILLNELTCVFNTVYNLLPTISGKFDYEGDLEEDFENTLNYMSELNDFIKTSILEDINNKENFNENK